ncbi:MAG TPA: hypothetical protein VNU68_35285 [Verrucomicrobiae bacterium]|nr:hypothetical protein [Verrucomicrobiae bacterium]
MISPGGLRSVDMAQRLLTASLNLEEAANTYAINPTVVNYHEMLVCMKEHYEVLTASFREIALR